MEPISQMPITPDERKEYGKMFGQLVKYAGQVVKYPLEEMAGLVGDWVSGHRLKNRIRLLGTVLRMAEERKIKIQKVLPDVFIPLLEAGGDTSDPTLSEMFANLLTANLDSKTQSHVHPSFGKVLSQLSPLDAQLLDFLDKKDREKHEAFGFNLYLILGEMAYPNQEREDMYLSAENLTRLGLLVDNGRYYLFTSYGAKFISVCTGREFRKIGAVSPIEELQQQITDLAKNMNSMGRNQVT